MQTDLLKNEFFRIYKDRSNEPVFFFSPGRVNLIGEHTDYNGGYVLPFALEYGTLLAIRLIEKPILRFASMNFEEKGEIEIQPFYDKQGESWFNYPLGVINELQKEGLEIPGLEFLFEGNIPNGAGLSSSASIEMVTMVAINSLLGLKRSTMDMVRLSQHAENRFVGVNCGIMDQFAVGFGSRGMAIFLNCRTLEYERVPLVTDPYIIIIANSNKKRGLTDSKYNERRSECEEAVRQYSVIKPTPDLSHLSVEDLSELATVTAPVVFRRARHIITENSRVLKAVELLKANNLTGFGRLMTESHESLRDDYEVTGIELDTLVEESLKIEGVLGSRMTGAGFGGCTITLIKASAAEKFIETVGSNYLSRTGLQAEFYTAKPGMGAGPADSSI